MNYYLNLDHQFHQILTDLRFEGSSLITTAFSCDGDIPSFVIHQVHRGLFNYNRHLLPLKFKKIYLHI
jgi:hypothetical protein